MNGYEQWNIIRRLLPKRKTQVGRPVSVDYRAVLNAIFYILRSGCQWRMLPHDFPAWGTVASQYQRWRVTGVWEKIQAARHTRVRIEAGTAPRPTAGVLDSQSIKTSEGAPSAATTRAKKSPAANATW